MSKGTKKSGHKSFGVQLTKTDFTLYDFAHVSPADQRCKSGRLKKGAVNAWSAEVKELCTKTMKPDESLSWYEKDIAEFELSDGEERNTAEILPTQEKTGIRKSRSVPRHDIVITSQDADRVVYPLDFWFMLGNSIAPEQVATFSCICRQSHAVVHSAQFWFSLYRRFYYKHPEVPVSLRPPSMGRVHGLRSRVIRALFHVYAPLSHRVSRTGFDDLDCLSGTRCVLAWHRHADKNLWHFYFKFHRESITGCPLMVTRPCFHPRSKSRALLAAADIHHNPEEGCVVLLAVASEFVALPSSPMGRVMARVSVSVGRDMRHHRLRLVFPAVDYRRAGGSDAGNSGGDDVFIVDPVMGVHVMHWWHPKYPCNQS